MSVWRSVRSALGLLNSRDRRILGLLTIVQALLSLLDVVAVTLVGLVALIAAGAATGELPAAVESVLTRFGLAEDDPYQVALLLAVIAGILLIVKSAASFYASRRTFAFLASRQALISGALASGLLRRPLLFVQSRSSQEFGYALTWGVNALTLGVIGQSVVIVVESSLLFVLAVTLLFFDPVITIFTVVFFAVIGFGLHRVISGWASRLGMQSQNTQIASFEAVQDALRTYREITVTGRRGMFVDRFQSLRWDAAQAQANLQIVGQISKYVFEVALIVGGALLAASQFLTRDLTSAIAGIAVFLTAASRVMPSLLRLQAAALQIRANAGTAEATLDLSRALTRDLSDEATITPGEADRLARGLREGYPGFTAEVRLDDVGLTYPGAGAPAVVDVSLVVPPATSLGIVGSTGSGKSTMADLALGVLRPDTGRVMVSGVDPVSAIQRWPGAIAYVPQDISVLNADIRSNVALGLPRDLVIDERVWESLEQAHLADFLREERDGLDTVVGEHGMRLSGGQRQRLGLARALYTRPRLIVLDEATSALDAETESAISRSIADLSGSVTLLIIAHRLATIRSCSQVAYLEGGRLMALGTFDEVRAQAQRLDRQARLLGL